MSSIKIARLKTNLHHLTVVPAKHSSKLEGFTRVMHQYLSAADVIITKPGGLTTAEALATGTVMAIVNPLPGQELRNADMVLEG